MQMINVKSIGEKYTKVDHPSGLTIYMCPMEGYSTAYAQFSTRYGSLDTCFKTKEDDDYLKVPEGIAHFLEHKMFEDEDGDAFGKFSKIGANANASTSFDRTIYEFVCSENFGESLKILINMVTKPHFTDESIAKEQGIIAQEIKMYNDEPGWCVYFNLLKALYHNHPITIDIAGTVESIAKIDKELLYSCYNTFYNLHNMVLSVSGNFDMSEVVSICDELLVKSSPLSILRGEIVEPESVKQKNICLKKPVSVPMFEIGFKNHPIAPENTLRKMMADNIMLEILAGDCSPLYSRLYDNGKITDSFGCSGMSNKGMFCNIFSGESNNPDEVLEELFSEIKLLRKKSISKADFERTRKFYYGKLIMGYNNVESTASAMTSAFIQDRYPFEAVDILSEMKLDDIVCALENNLNFDKVAMSIVEPDKQ